MEVELPKGKLCQLEYWKPGMEKDLPSIANNIKIWRNVRDVFPHPYTAQDAKNWIEYITQPAGIQKYTNFAICIPSEDKASFRVAGGLGIHTQDDVSKKVVILGYWLGEPFWNKGIVTEAVQLAVNYTFSSNFTLINNGCSIERIEASVYEYNKPSARVLEKNGFVLEAVQKRAFFKDGKVIDGLLYVKLRE